MEHEEPEFKKKIEGYFDNAAGNLPIIRKRTQ
jgi:hypothetical protein